MLNAHLSALTGNYCAAKVLTVQDRYLQSYQLVKVTHHTDAFDAGHFQHAGPKKKQH